MNWRRRLIWTAPSSTLRSCSHPAFAADVIARLDRLTAEYGGEGAYDRSEQSSDEFISNELEQLSNVTPAAFIFLSTTAFILNIVFSRVIRTQREQDARHQGVWLRAMGDRVALLADGAVQPRQLAAVGLTAGYWLGQAMTAMYSQFRFPAFAFDFEERAVVVAIAVAGGTAIVGVLASVRRAARLPPAEAMRPKRTRTIAPHCWKRLAWSDSSGRANGVAASRATAVAGVADDVRHQPGDRGVDRWRVHAGHALSYLMNFMFSVTQRQDVMVAFNESASPSTDLEVTRLPGVLEAETFRAVPRAGFAQVHTHDCKA